MRKGINYRSQSPAYTHVVGKDMRSPREYALPRTTMVHALMRAAYLGPCTPLANLVYAHIVESAPKPSMGVRAIDKTAHIG